MIAVQSRRWHRWSHTGYNHAMLRIGNVTLENPLLLAPIAVTGDRGEEQGVLKRDVADAEHGVIVARMRPPMPSAALYGYHCVIPSGASHDHRNGILPP